MNQLYFSPIVGHLFFTANLSIKSFCPPRDVVHSTQSIDVQNIEIGGTVENERKGAEEDVNNLAELAEDERYEDRDGVQAHNCNHDIAEGVDGGLTPRDRVDEPFVGN